MKFRIIKHANGAYNIQRKDNGWFSDWESLGREYHEYNATCSIFWTLGSAEARLKEYIEEELSKREYPIIVKEIENGTDKVYQQLVFWRLVVFLCVVGIVIITMVGGSTFWPWNRS